jgi:site-specific DNA-methyltransferase (adenine-specific)
MGRCRGKYGRRAVFPVNSEERAWAEKRLELAKNDRSIQGYVDGVFWERNTAHYIMEKFKKG